MLVPQFSGWADSHDFTFGDGQCAESSIVGMPPGHYRFSAMRRRHDIEFRNPANSGEDLGSGHDVRIKARGIAEAAVTEPPLD